MALTRKFLKAMGIDEEKIDEIIAAHSDTVNALKDERDRYKESHEKLSSVQKELDAVKSENSDNDSYKEKYEKEHKEFENYKKASEEKELKAKKISAYKSLLKDSGINEKRIDAIVKITSFDEIKLDKDGNIENSDDLKKNIKSEYSEFIVSESVKGANTSTPPENVSGNKMTKADIYKKDEHGRYILSTAERQKALAENIGE